MSYAYDQYLAEHIGNVNKGLNWMLDNLGLKEEKAALEEAMVSFNHDESKYSTEEYDAYDQYFYGGNKSYKVVRDFNYAWLHHIHQNPHHWQYWVLLEDDPKANGTWIHITVPGTGEYNAAHTKMPVFPLEIPVPYIFEMIADWWSFSWKSGNLFEIFNWYADHRSKQIINPKSREIVEYILEKIWKVLIMQETVAGHDISEIEAQYKRFWAGQEDVVDKMVELGHPNVLTAQEIESLVKHSDISEDEPIGKVISAIETENGLEVTVEYSKDKQGFWKHLIEDGENDLEHTGIKGMKWGVRNGPPYPLSTERNSKVRMNYIRDSKWIRSHQVPQSELERHPIEKLSDLKRLEKDDDIMDVRWRVNAMKDNYIGRYYNCQNCAAAFDMIERGYNVCARPKQSGSNVGNIEDLYDGGKLSHCEMDKQLADYDDAYQARKEVANKLITELSSQGVGARGILVVGQAKDIDMDDTSQCSGFHAINYKIESESQGFLKKSKPVVKIYDLQSSHHYNHEGTDDYTTVFFDSDPRDIYFMRTDNLEPSDLMTSAVYSNNGIGELNYDRK